MHPVINILFYRHKPHRRGRYLPHRPKARRHPSHIQPSQPEILRPARKNRLRLVEHTIYRSIPLPPRVRIQRCQRARRQRRPQTIPLHLPADSLTLPPRRSTRPQTPRQILKPSFSSQPHRPLRFPRLQSFQRPPCRHHLPLHTASPAPHQRPAQPRRRIHPARPLQHLLSILQLTEKPLVALPQPHPAQNQLLPLRAA